MSDAPERYGRRNVAKMIRQVDAHRHAVRAEGSPAIQETWDRIEEHIDYAYRADVRAMQARIDALVEVERTARKLEENLGVKGVDVGLLRVDLYRVLAAIEAARGE